MRAIIIALIKKRKNNIMTTSFFCKFLIFNIHSKFTVNLLYL